MRLATVFLAGASIALVACGGTASDDNVAAVDPNLAPQVVAVEAGDYFFNAPDTIEAGMTTFRLAAGGNEFHHIVAVRLENGRTTEELMQHVGTAHSFPEWAHEVGGPNAPVPGEVSEATVDLAPGSYALVCVIPSSDGTPHVMKGMIRPLTVVARSGPNAPPPESQIVMTLSDYDFVMTPVITPGRQTIKLENVAEQAHEAFLVQLAPGKTLEDLMTWLQNEQGPPPGRPMGGITFLANGELNYVTMDFEPGEYALICFVPDAGDGRPHFMHGMMKQFRVG